MLIPCVVCGKEISAHAKNCPHCGHPLTVYAEKKSRKKLIVLFLCALGTLIVLAGAYEAFRPPKSSRY